MYRDSAESYVFTSSVQPAYSQDHYIVLTVFFFPNPVIVMTISKELELSLFSILSPHLDFY